ncbi:MAG: hypothetical protein KZQ64_03300 [gamma proteobacterium symbiont of Bathyaustriella thionipta]|nr:hypothetical protein [gamma proteobacterium symbiont of Bathyaustriella thionipta]MCU7950057.1 hypothetical protein [gamma proteobacterium symbiont of Bathyaustriella thionipta]MCU7952408.1 hypothetical protein [gamma proteobacterium symbiont of Bathyaustriella thionipta]MCU7956653.1 hypothetical protein [gamma proteobacterium symbiont of Bathyaustriella thionipta]MCU7968019.1 hypothetical protein [gamma proteobacterium symbiont of Bathyaustriella thionipta]
MGAIQVMDEHRDYAGGLENFASCASKCADADMLLQRFFDILTHTQEKGKYLVIQFDEFNPDSHFIMSRGVDNSYSQQITHNFTLWSKQPENLPSKLSKNR